ncbi:MAG TPA: 2-oxoglutarate dehydrogenase E1 component [Vicinamibacterales bacterium]|jgi:2-oxoglutarate dehydrogenase E1 component|nr:2-oxoglutarate dehydrogenase E1 component [Vicinamibacterales bacterium]
MAGWEDFSGINRGYVLELYERYRHDPSSVDDDTRRYFERWSPPADEPVSAARPQEERRSERTAAIVGAVALAQSIRRYGHLAARIDPLGSRPPGDPLLLERTHGVTEEDLKRLPAAIIGGPIATEAADAAEAIAALRRVYCSTTGYDLAHIFVPEEREWLRESVERGRFRPPAAPVDERALLERLTDVEVLERFVHRSFPGKTRFSIEGLDMLVPVLDTAIAGAADAGIGNVIIGMAHRGRLNVMAHVLGKPYEQILAEFKDPLQSRSFREDMAWSGDVKYHAGASRSIADEESRLVVTMPPNPSHLEAVDPIVVGMARAAGTRADQAGAPSFDPTVSLPVLIHGDAAFPGQGVVAETLNLYRLPGYQTGGTIHIIANNQLGFTTLPEEAYSTSYASGLARGFKIPILHVNADDAEACVAAARLAFEYRARFRRDVLIDLVGYRRYGHNEGDEPAFTQPLMYQRIASHPTVREIWARALQERGVVDEALPDALVRERMDALQRTLDALRPEEALVEPQPELAPAGAARRARTAVPLDRLRALNNALLKLPDDFSIHRKLEKARERRRQVLDDPDARTIEWSTAEELALGSILEDGVAIRMTGEDVQRGTFSQRHAVFHDVKTGAKYTPLQGIPHAKAAFEIHNSPLSENAVLGFEYGYSIQSPSRLVIWEAQYGDFINGAQVVVDEFLVSARAKWGQEPSLVLLLPHGHEGQGPDHASARPERFLQLAADVNIRVANCTTAAQYFHLLRRQAALLVDDPLPLIVLTPKSLLRHPFVASAARELSEGRWRPVLDDETVAKDQVKRLLLCSGKIAVDLFTSDDRQSAREAAIVRVEQLYPFPVDDVQAAIASYPAATDVVWVQEEPENMGAWEFVRPHLEALVGQRRLAVLARPRSSSPAEGSAARHARNQQLLIRRALNPQGSPREEATHVTENRGET